MHSPSALFIIAAAMCSCIASAFSGNFEISNVVASSPFQADPTSTLSTLISFDFRDQDTPEVGSNRCGVEWAVGLSPPVPWQNTCDNTTFGVRITSWHGVQNFSIDLKHTYVDDKVGQYPYNVLTKFAPLNLTYPFTKNYQCDLSQAECESYTGVIIIANLMKDITVAYPRDCNRAHDGGLPELRRNTYCWGVGMDKGMAVAEKSPCEA